MAEKFANYRWVKEGFLDNTIPGHVVGRVEFAGIGVVDFCLNGNFKPDIEGTIFRFSNAKFIDDASAASRLEGLANPQLGKVSLISFDPHPLLDPHPYIEWFSAQEDHYRIELESGEGWVVEGEEAQGLHEEALKLYGELAGKVNSESEPKCSPRGEQEWF